MARNRNTIVVSLSKLPLKPDEYNTLKFKKSVNEQMDTVTEEQNNLEPAKSVRLVLKIFRTEICRELILQ